MGEGKAEGGRGGEKERKSERENRKSHLTLLCKSRQNCLRDLDDLKMEEGMDSFVKLSFNPPSIAFAFP